MIINPYIYSVATSYDSDAQLFFNAQSGAGVTLTLTQMNAVNQWVVDAKAAGIWTKMKAVYPMVGGTATAHKFNLKNPLDTDAAFRLLFNGGGTHSSNGYQPGGVNGYADTFFAPSVNSTGINNFHNSYYSRTNVNLTQVEAGCGSSDLQGTLLEVRTANITYIRINANTVSSYADTDSLGLYTQSRLLGNQQKGYKNNLLKITGTVNSNTTPGQYFYIGAYNSNGVAVYYSSKECAFATIGDGLTDLESQLFYQITEKYQVALGRNINTLQSFYYNSAYNNETNAFLFSTQITDNTIQTATNTLVTDLKTAGVFTKMKAIYPMVGGTATTHKFNLINPQDTNSAFRLTFVGGGTHSVNGYLPNGVNAYADTFITPTTSLTNNNTHLSFYSRTNSVGLYFDMGSGQPGGQYLDLALNITGNIFADQYNNTTGRITTANANSQGFYISSRTLSNVFKLFKNSAQIGTTNTGASTGFASLTSNLNLSALREGTSNLYFSNRQCAFASAGDGLTDLESQVFYQIIEKFQVALGRNINPTQSFYYNTAYNNETNAFLFSTQITNATIQTATNQLVLDLKSANIWTKMKALYPMVGGTATTHKFNLIDPQDTNAAFRLAFSGGGTHSANGYQPNGVNAFADTFLSPSTSLTLNSTHLSYYSRTNITTDVYSIGAYDNTNSLTMYANYAGNNYSDQYNGVNGRLLSAVARGDGLFIGNRTASNVHNSWRNTTKLGTSTVSTALGSLPSFKILLAAIQPTFINGAKQCAFASIGDGLTDAEALALYNAVQTFNTTLARQV